MIDDIPLTMFLCSRSTPPPAAVTIRKFVSPCGEKLVAKISERSAVVEADDGMHDIRRCPACKTKVTFIKELVKTGK